MKQKTLFISVIILLLLSACNKRFGHIPKARTKNKTRVIKPRRSKKAKRAVSLTVKRSIKVKVDTLISYGTRLPVLVKKPLVRYENRQNFNQNKRKRVKTNKKEMPQLQIAEVGTETLKKTAINKQQKTNSSDFWEDLWSDFLIELIGAILLLALASFFIWLESIGLGWVVVLIGIALLVLLIIWLGQVVEDFFDMVFP